MSGDPFTKEIIRSYMSATLLEMIKTTARAAYSPTLSEGLDFSCALFSRDGRMVAQAAGIGVHLGALRPVLRRTLERYSEFAEGDVIVTNDPYLGTHQPDVVVMRPMYAHGEHLGFAVNIGHWNDIGSAAAGGCAGTSTHVVQDGLIIPISRLYRRGRLVEEVQDFITSNVRFPKAAMGDLQAQLAACSLAEARLTELVDRYGVEAVREAMDHAIEYAQGRFLSGMTSIPDGTYEATDYIEDDGVSDAEYLLRMTIRKDASGFNVDFAGTSGQAPTPINGNLSTTSAAVYAGIIAVVDSSLPPNEGVFDLIKISAPPQTIVNAQRPVSVFGATFEVPKRVSEMVFRALSSVVPDRVAAGGFSSGNNISARCVADDGADDAIWYYYLEGGQGARLNSDGNSAVYHWHGTPTNQPIEIWEHRYPVRYRKFALIPDSGGDGQYRGGLGTVREIECLWDHFVSGLADRQRIPPWGLHGGGDGQPNRWSVVRDGVQSTFQEAFDLPSNSKFTDVLVRKGEVIVLETGGGGGFGDPLLRSEQLRERDRVLGYTSDTPSGGGGSQA